MDLTRNIHTQDNRHAADGALSPGTTVCLYITLCLPVTCDLLPSTRLQTSGHRLDIRHLPPFPFSRTLAYPDGATLIVFGICTVRSNTKPVSCELLSRKRCAYYIYTEKIRAFIHIDRPLGLITVTVVIALIMAFRLIKQSRVYMSAFSGPAQLARNTLRCHEVGPPTLPVLPLPSKPVSDSVKF